MSGGMRHPLTGAIYERDGENIRVTAADGTTGLFGRDGHWIEGDLRECDAQACGWVGGPRVMNHRLMPAKQQV